MFHKQVTEKQNTSSDHSSDRSFGFLFAGVFTLLAGYRWYHNPDSWVVYGWVGAAFVVAVISLVMPKILIPFKKAWFYLGEALGKIVNPVVLGVIFFVLITPLAVITRLFGRDELRLKRKTTNSYWIDRDPPGPVADSFKNQF